MSATPEPDPTARGPRLRPSGGYRKLRSFQAATIIYDGTVSFCERFMDKRSRTVDQMIQAARSGRQNIAEGSRANATSSKTELHLTNVARSSLDELLLDYEDFLRQRKLRKWGKDDPEAREVRNIGSKNDLSDPDEAGDRARWALYAPWLENSDPAVVANALICLINQANYLLDKQISVLEQQFVQQGGYSEQLATARIAEREKVRSEKENAGNLAMPNCQLCGKVMVLRTARQGKNAGSQFLGCTGFPGCKGTRQLDGVAHPSNLSDPTDKKTKTD